MVTSEYADRRELQSNGRRGLAVAIVFCHLLAAQQHQRCCAADTWVTVVAQLFIKVHFLQDERIPWKSCPFSVLSGAH